MVVVALSARKVIMWHAVQGVWNAAEAAHVCQSVIGPAFAKHYPRKRKYLFLEASDPSGYKNGAAEDVKKTAGISPMIFLKRSPDMNLLDYGLWSCINKRLREQEAAFPKSKRETRKEYIKRLSQTILRVPASVLGPLVSPMKRRCQALEKAGGKGGRKPSYKKRHFKLAKNTLTYAASAKPDAKVLGIIQLSGGSVKQTGENVTVVDSQGRKNGAHAPTQPVAPSCPAHQFNSSLCRYESQVCRGGAEVV